MRLLVVGARRRSALGIVRVVGDLVRRSVKANIAAPLIAAACVHLAVYQNKIAAAR
jgi:hypothetical protein